MSRLIDRGRAPVLAVTLLLGAFLTLSCQPTQPVATPKPAEKAAATATKPAEKAAEKPVRGGTLRVVLGGEPESLDLQAYTAQELSFSTHDFMIAPDKDMINTKEGLFKDWTIAPDGRSITFKLREGVKFHDGTDFDAEAAKSNIERMKDPALKSPYRSYYDAVTSVTVVDPLTVRFNLSRADPMLLVRMGTQGGAIVSPTAVKKWGQDYGRHPVGTGPFQFVEWANGDHITIKRFDGYWKKDAAGNQLPYLDQVIIRIIPDASTATANLRTGQIELMGGGGVGFPVSQLPLVKGDANLTYLGRSSPGVQGMYVQTKKPPFDNKALRQAMALAVDREGMAIALGEGNKAWASLFHPLDWGYDGKSGMFPARDLAKAKAKMAEAGYAGGVKVNLTAGNAPDTVKRAEVLKANLAEIGIDADLKIVASTAWLTAVAVVESDYQISVGGTLIPLTDPGHVFSLHFASKASRNYFGPYSNLKVDELIDKAGNTYDQKERAAFYQEASNLLVEDAPFIVTHSPSKFVALSKKVQNFFIYGDGIARFREVWLAP